MKRHAALVPLSRQHHDGLALCVLIERGLRDDAGPSVAERLRRQALDAWRLELSGHFAVEEEVLFPRARKAVPEPEALDRLTREHAEIRREFATLKAAAPDDVATCLRSLRKRLVAHIRFEERVVFEAVQSAMGEQDLADLGLRIEEALPRLCLHLGSADVSARTQT